MAGLPKNALANVPGPTQTLNAGFNRCGTHVPVRWSQLCVVYTYQPLTPLPTGVGEKTFQMPIIDQQVSGCWEFHGKQGRTLVEKGEKLSKLCRRDRGLVDLDIREIGVYCFCSLFEVPAAAPQLNKY